METLPAGDLPLPLTTAGPPAPSIVPPLAYCRIEHFLGPDQLEHLLGEVVSRQNEFVPSETSTEEPNYRQSLVLHTAMEVLPEFVELVGACVPLLKQVFVLEDEAFSMEKQITAHNDGHYFKVHNDSGHPPDNS